MAERHSRTGAIRQHLTRACPGPHRAFPARWRTRRVGDIRTGRLHGGHTHTTRTTHLTHTGLPLRDYRAGVTKRPSHTHTLHTHHTHTTCVACHAASHLFFCSLSAVCRTPSLTRGTAFLVRHTTCRHTTPAALPAYTRPFCLRATTACPPHLLPYTYLHLPAERAYAYRAAHTDSSMPPFTTSHAILPTAAYTTFAHRACTAAPRSLPPAALFSRCCRFYPRLLPLPTSASPTTPALLTRFLVTLLVGCPATTTNTAP